MDEPRPSNCSDPGIISAAAGEPSLCRRSLLRAGGGLIASVLLPWGCRGGQEPDVVTPSRPVVQERPAVAPRDPRPLPPTAEPIVRVLLERRRGEPLEIAAAGRWIRVRDRDDAPGLVFAAPLRVSRVEADGGWRWRLEPATGPALRAESGTLMLGTAAGEPPQLRCGGAAVGGDLRLVPDGDRFDLVTHLALETYLPGVLAKELYASWSLPCFRAQAVAARSFATKEVAHWATRRHFDLTTGPDTQAWGGLAATGKAVQAVAETRGMLLLWDDRVVPGFYSSSCGGAPANAEDAIGPSVANRIAPLQAREDGGLCCEQAPTYRWQVTMPAGELHRRVVAWGARHDLSPLASIGRLVRIEPVSVNRLGRPIRFLLEDERGRREELPAERLRSALAQGGGVGARVRSGNLEVRNLPAEADLHGRGYGHGVGLCQYGAEAMGRRGALAETILARYYPGAELRAAWG
jgi:stage II sporulation protein D